MNRPNYAELDEGIRDVVRMLNDHGIETCDSGDGSKAGEMECAIEIPHVFAQAEKRGLDGLIEAFGLCHRMRDLLGDGWDVQIAYRPSDDGSLIMAFQGECEIPELVNGPAGDA